MDLLHHFELHPLVHLELFGIDISITKAVLFMWIACFLLLVLLSLAVSKVNAIPRGLQKIFEPILLFIRDDLVLENIGKDAIGWFPFIATIFLFVLTCNLIGLFPGSYTATSNINVTAALALVVFFTVQFTAIRKHGVLAYLKGVWFHIPEGTPLVIGIAMIPIEIIGNFAKPFSLAIRLFANMFAGHMIILVFLGLIIQFKSVIIAPLPLAGVVLMSTLEIGFSVIQAYVFTILSTMYISAAVHLEH